MKTTMTLAGLGLCALLATACSTTTAKPTVAASSGCSALTDVNAATAPFYDQKHVYAAERVERLDFRARAIQLRKTAGADIYMHAPAGVSGEYLERALRCHAARPVAANATDPLHPASGTVAGVEVRLTGDGFVVRVTGETYDSGSEIWQRAKAFAAPSGTVTVEQVGSTSTPSAM